MLVKFEQNGALQTARNFELFDKKKGLKKKEKKNVFDKALTPFWKTFLKLKHYCLMLNC